MSLPFENSHADASAAYEPPHPALLPPLAALARTIWLGDGDLLSLLPAEAYRAEACELGYSRRSIKLFNDPALVREILGDDGSMFPKSDLMVGALEPLIGQSMFVTDGPKWRRQRAMIDPAFSMMRLNIAFAAMGAAVDDYETRLDAAVAAGAPISLDLAMSHLTADVICRAVFSVSLASDIAKEVFEDFTVFERGVGQVKVWRLIVDPAWKSIRQDDAVLAACARIRNHIGSLIDTHRGDGVSRYNDIASAVIAARDETTGEPFSRDELIDQLGVFFLAGHETTASALTWAFYILSERPEIAARLRAEVHEVAGDGPISFDAVKKLAFTRSVFRETMRLYPPLTFLPRVAMRSGAVGRYKLRRGALVMISPWTLHRHRKYWTDPNRFDPDRFSPEREREITPGAYIPFGAGPHTCVGAGFALVEAVLIIARLMRRFSFKAQGDAPARPAARMTTRPAREVFVSVRRHQEPASAV
ncbi:MAG: cytochrome P450 [Pseudomonadota bacterium]